MPTTATELGNCAQQSWIRGADQIRSLNTKYWMRRSTLFCMSKTHRTCRYVFNYNTDLSLGHTYTLDSPLVHPTKRFPQKEKREASRPRGPSVSRVTAALLTGQQQASLCSIHFLRSRVVVWRAVWKPHVRIDLNEAPSAALAKSHPPFLQSSPPVVTLPELLPAPTPDT